MNCLTLLTPTLAMASIIDIKLPKAIATALRIPQNDPQRQQIRVLKKLLKKARFTEFGQHYMFDGILFGHDIREAFQELVPVHDYNKIYNRWWKKTLDGVPDVTWPGKIKYYALSSGTSEAASRCAPPHRPRSSSPPPATPRRRCGVLRRHSPACR